MATHHDSRHSNGELGGVRARGLRSRPPEASSPELDFDHAAFVDRLWVLIRRLGGQSAAERLCGVPHSSMSRWLNRKRHCFPSMPTLLKLTRHADVSMDWLLGYAVPQRRSDREQLGDLRRELRKAFMAEISARTGVPSHHVDRMSPSGTRLFESVIRSHLNWDWSQAEFLESSHFEEWGEELMPDDVEWAMALGMDPETALMLHERDGTVEVKFWDPPAHML